MLDNSSALENLIRAGLGGDKTGVKNIVDQIAKDAERDGDDNLLRLLRLASMGASKGGSFEDKTDMDAIKAAFDKKAAGNDEIPLALQKQKTDAQMKDMILRPEIVELIEETIDEQNDYQEFLDGGLKPRHKILLLGPPGNGKTQVTKAFANRMGLPLYFVRYDSLISQRAGETSQNLNSCFEFAKTHRCILFFDEIDAIGKERSDPNETAEMKRVVSTLLVQLDDVPPHVICMGATNHAQMLDRAFLRRFDLRIQLPGPETDEYERYLKMQFKRFGHEPKQSMRVIALAIEVENYAEAEIFVADCIRTFIKQKKKGNPLNIDQAIDMTLDIWPKARAKIPK
jgi:SpoVK/Ycf46/Vps4 family AAA+-type ATPase